VAGVGAGEAQAIAQRDEGILDCLLRPVFGSRRMRSIARADVQLLVDTLATTHAPSSALRTFSCLRAVFSFAEREEIVVRNPTRGTRLPRVSLTTRPVLDGDQVDRVAQGASTHLPGTDRFV
jgi:site-specific recombinase XerD